MGTWRGWASGIDGCGYVIESRHTHPRRNQTRYEFEAVTAHGRVVWALGGWVAFVCVSVFVSVSPPISPSSPSPLCPCLSPVPASALSLFLLRPRPRPRPSLRAPPQPLSPASELNSECVVARRERARRIRRRRVRVVKRPRGDIVGRGRIPKRRDSLDCAPATRKFELPAPVQ